MHKSQCLIILLGLASTFHQPTEDNDESRVKRLIPCPLCVDSGTLSTSSNNNGPGHNYTVEDLTIMATHGAKDQIKCPEHGKPVLLKSLVPDVFLNDLQVFNRVDNKNSIVL